MGQALPQPARRRVGDRNSPGLRSGGFRGRVHAGAEAERRAPKVIAGLARIVRDVGLAEDLAHDALVAALEQWPSSGVPRNPGAWLMAIAKHRAIDQLRRRSLLERKHAELGYELEIDQALSAPDLDGALDDEVGDDLLRLVFVASHPVLATEARVALTLRLLGGLTTDEIARAYLVSQATIAQRIVRAKRTLAEKQIPFEVPRGAELAARLSSVLEVIYLVFNEGYSATAGDEWMRPALCEDALRLGRILSELVPDEPEVHGLVALMEIQASRARARVGPTGEPVLLFDQNRALWDRLLIGRGLTALERARKLGGVRGRYALQAAIAACHARALAPGDTDWPEIVRLYAELAERAPSPVVELNRAVAVGMAFGAAAGLEIVDRLTADPALDNYHLLPSVRGDLLAKLGRRDEARRSAAGARAEHADMTTTSEGTKSGSSRPRRAREEARGGPRLWAAATLAAACLACSHGVGHGDAPAVRAARAGTREATVEQVAPARDSVGAAPARFAWAAVQGADSYAIGVWNEVDQLLWREDHVLTTSVDSPESLRLEPGTYFWSVSALRDGQQVAESGLAAFVVRTSP